MRRPRQLAQGWKETACQRAAGTGKRKKLPLCWIPGRYRSNCPSRWRCYGRSANAPSEHRWRPCIAVPDVSLFAVVSPGITSDPAELFRTASLKRLTELLYAASKLSQVLTAPRRGFPILLRSGRYKNTETGI